MTGCPPLAVLETAPVPPHVRMHADGCTSCRLVVELFAQARGSRASADECSRFDALLAARGDGALGQAGANLLARHLAGCPACRAVAATLAPTTDARADLAQFPPVDPACYELGREIGRGGMGRIVAARDLRIGRPVAVKELLATSPLLAARFEREARVTARLQHPGIVPIYELGQWPDGTPFYAMRMYEGRTLRHVIDQADSLAARLSLLPSLIAATEAVAFAHGERIIHRDLTPSNVMVGDYGETVVIDWGLAKDLGAPIEDGGDDALDEPRSSASPDDALTGDGAVLGTVAYMPPEQANGEAVDERADVYAIGALLYDLLAGMAPYSSCGRGELMAALKAGPPASIATLARKAPRDLISIVDKAMARDPALRYPSARELADELHRFQTGAFVEAHAYTTGERMRRFVVRNRAPLAIAVVALAAVALLGTLAIARVLRERRTAEATVVALLGEEGRAELLAGSPLRALAYLEAAYRATARPSAALRFMRAHALRDISLLEGDLDCGGPARNFVFAPDGETLAAACTDRGAVWRLADRTLVTTLGPTGDGFMDVAYSHDGRALLTWGGDGVARLWDPASGTLRRSFLHAQDVTISLATFTPDDAFISTSGHDGWAKIWDARTGDLVRAIHGSDATLRHHLYGMFSHDGRRLLTLTIAGIGAAWDAATGAHLGGFTHGGATLGGETWEHGPRAVSCGGNRLVKVWNTETGALVAQLAGATNAVWSCRFSADGELVLGTSHDHHAYVWSVATGAAVTSVDHGAPLWTGYFSADARRFVTTSLAGGSTKVWDTITGGLLERHDTHGGLTAKLSLDGQRLVAALGDGRVRIWRASARSRRTTYVAPAGMTVVGVARDGARALVQGADGVTLVDTRTGARIGGALGAPATIGTTRAVAMQPGGALAVVDVTDGAILSTLARTGEVQHLELTLDERRVQVRRLDAIETWDLASGARVPGVADDFPLAPGTRAIAVSANGRWLVAVASAGGTQRATVWEVPTRRLVVERDDVSAPPTLDPGGRYLTMVLGNHRVETWDLAAAWVAQPRTAFVSDQLQTAQLDPRGELIAAVDVLGEQVVVLAATDGRLLARWPIAHDAPLVSQDGFDPPRAAATWSPDGASIIAVSRHDLAVSFKAKLLGGELSGRVSVFDAEQEVHDSQGALVEGARLAALIDRNVPWRVVRGRIVPALAPLSGRIVRGGLPVSGVALSLVFRKPPELDGDVLRSRVTMTDAPLPPLAVTADGRFSTQVQPGRYTLRISERGVPAGTLDIDLGVGDTPREFDLAALQAR